MRQIANIISILFHPLLMVTYGLLMAFSMTSLFFYPVRLKLLMLGFVFVATAVIPMLSIFLVVRYGGANNVDLTERRDRVIPYLVFMTSLLVCGFYLNRMLIPLWLLMPFFGGVVALLLAMCINFMWKISAHSIGIGCLLGAVMGIARIQLSNPYELFIILIIIAGCVGSSRIFLQKHTSAQVYSGFCLGFICTFVASILRYIHLII